jgi:hypothetical protein
MNDENEILSPGEKSLISENAGKINRSSQIIWVTWWGGTALIVGSWLGIVSNTIGWIGFSLAISSSFISVMISKYWKFPKS